MATAVKKKATKKKLATARKSAAATNAPADRRAIYLYGISLPVRETVEIRAEAVDALDAIQSLRLDGVDCWISRVDRGEYAERLAENMENLEWLATVGVRHQRAVADLASKLEILPARFGTVFLSEESLRSHVQSENKGIQSVFKKITGCDEWGVKVFRVAPAAQPAALVDAASGTDYLKQKARTVMPRAKQEDPALASMLRELNEISADSAPGGKASTGQPSLVWHGSFLVRRNQQKKFASALRKFTEKFSDRYRVECSGPWPPYSFVGQHG
jgi:Gas vesicle synthesis protein GvpL/GvpF